MSCLFSKTQNHLCREPDRHGAGRTSHADLRSLRRPHSLHHLEDFHPKHQQRRKGMTSPKRFRALGCPLEASRICPMAAEPEEGCGHQRPQPRPVASGPQPALGGAQLLAQVCRAVMLAGVVKLAVLGRRRMGILKGTGTAEVLVLPVHPGKCVPETLRIRMNLSVLFLMLQILMLHLHSMPKAWLPLCLPVFLVPCVYHFDLKAKIISSFYIIIMMTLGSTGTFTKQMRTMWPPS